MIGDVIVPIASPQLPRPNINQRMLIMGPTESGKTELMRALLKPMPHVIVLDPKRRFSWHDDGQRYQRMAHDLRELVAHLKQIEDRGLDEPVIYRPPEIEPEYVDAVYKIAYDRGFTHVYNDDFAVCVEGAARPKKHLPHWYRVRTLGRQRIVGCSESIQRPSEVPLIAYSESDFRITFYLRMPEDQKRAEHLCGRVDWEFLAQNDFSFVWATDKYSSDPMRLRLRASSPLEAPT